MAFDASPLTGDAASPRPVGGQFASYGWTIAQDGGDSGGTFRTPFTDEVGIEVEGWTPNATGPVSATPQIAATAVDSDGFVTVEISTDVNANGVLRLVGPAGM